jgi:hypothetical protein
MTQPAIHKPGLQAMRANAVSENCRTDISVLTRYPLERELCAQLHNPRIAALEYVKDILLLRTSHCYCKEQHQ